MSDITLEYYDDSDTLFIALSDKRSLTGDQEYQNGIVLFRDEKSHEVIGIEIIDFSSLNENKIQISKSEALDMSKPFSIIKTAINFKKIANQYPTVFEHLTRNYISSQKTENLQIKMSEIV